MNWTNFESILLEFFKLESQNSKLTKTGIWEEKILNFSKSENWILNEFQFDSTHSQKCLVSELKQFRFVRHQMEQIPNCHNTYKFCTVWKFHDFSITQILCEINSEGSKRSTYALFGALNCKNQHSKPPNVLKWQILRL